MACACGSVRLLLAVTSCEIEAELHAGCALEACGFKVNRPHQGFQGQVAGLEGHSGLGTAVIPAVTAANGLYLCLQRYTFVLRQLRQNSPLSGQCTASNHMRATTSSGIRFANSESVTPYPCERPGFAMVLRSGFPHTWNQMPIVSSILHNPPVPIILWTFCR